MSELSHTSNQLRQPAMRPPEETGDPIVDKANSWFFNAQWEANGNARQLAFRAAEENGLPAPEPTIMPDFTDEDSAFLTTLADNMHKEGTQQMLAMLQDMREGSRIYRGVETIGEQMQIVQAVMQNPDLQ